MAHEIAEDMTTARQSRVADPADAPNPAEQEFAEFDDPAFHDRYVRHTGIGLLEVDLFVPGVHCASCLRVIERLPTMLTGVVSAQLDLARKILRVRWQEGIVSLSTIATTLQSMGYTPAPAFRSSSEGSRKRDDRRQLVRLGIAGLCAGNVMLISFALYGGQFEGMDHATAQVLRWLSLAFSAVCLGWPGMVFLRGAWLAVRMKTVTMDVPITLGIGAAFVWSTVATIARTADAGVTATDIYFDSLAMLIFFLLIGRFIQHRQQRRAQDSIELLFSLTPASARVIEVGADGVEQVRVRPASAVNSGATVEILAGEMVPADGVLTKGSSQFNTAILTGESIPTTLHVGDAIAAGTTNLSRLVRVRVTATGMDTRVGQLMSLVAEHSRRRAPIVLLADKMALYFLIAMLALAGVTVAIWWHSGPRTAILNAIALLIVACPCGLGLATPMAMTVALGRAAKEHLLIKGGSAIQALAAAERGGTFCFDKTATLTEGRLKLMHWSGAEDVKPLLAALESQSTHPIAAALVRDLPSVSRECVVESATNIGGGIGGTIRTNGAAFSLNAGTERFIRSSGVDVPERWQAEARRVAATGLSPVLVAQDGVVVALVGLGDPLRAEAKELIATLRHRGSKVIILSGDHPDVVRGMATRLGLSLEDAHGHVTPERKALFVQESKSAHPSHPVVMIGDGVNDAAALAAADVGIAVHGGAEASLAAADIYCGSPGLAPLVRLFAGAKSTMRTVRVALIVSLLYNAVAAVLAMSGQVSPLLAAVLMPAASLTVVAVAMTAWKRDRHANSESITDSHIPSGMEGASCPSFS